MKFCMTVSRDPVNHKIWLWYKIDARKERHEIITKSKNVNFEATDI